MGVKIADKLEQFNNGTYYLVDSSAVEYVDKDGNVKSVKDVLDNTEELSKEYVERLLGLTKEEIEAMADLILDTEVRLDKTYSSSKIYSSIQDAIDTSKAYTLSELGKMSGASYKVVTATNEMTDEKIIYLLDNGTTFDMYIVDSGIPTKIGDTNIDLSDYYTKTEVDNDFLKKTDAASTYATKTELNEKANDDEVAKKADITDLENRVTTNEANITDLQEQTSDLQEQIYNLDIPDTTDLTNVRKVFCNIDELNNAKGTNMSLVIGEDNTEKIINVLKPYEEFVNWFGNATSTDRFGIDESIGIRLNVISIQKFTNDEGLAYAITNEGKVFSRYFQYGVLSEWDYDSTDLTEMNTKLIQLENTVNQVVKKTDITNTIDINSSGMKIPNVKAIYDDIIEGKVIDQTVIDKYGTEILKYPLGIWRISNDSLSTKFSDLPVKTSGRIEITSVDANINKNPWNSTWSYRTYTFETHSGMNYLRKLSNGGTAGVIENDTGWQKVCVTSVADVPNTVIVSENTKVKLNSNCYYTVINGVCYVILWGFICTEAGKYLVNTSMPKTKLTMHGVCTYGSNGSEGGCAYVFYDGNGSNKLYIEVKTTEPLYGSFSYPVAE